MIGRTLDHYEVVGKLGKGGMGEVYRARDTRLDRGVAIKVLPDEVASDPERLARFEREAKLLASLSHPGIATLYGIETVPDPSDASSGSSRSLTFLTMELVEGGDLAERISGGPIPVREAISLARQIAEGLEAAHGQGIIHRDLKPANIMITADQTVKILDFGLAKATRAESGDGDVTDLPTLTQDLTQVGTTLGTAPYMSPEQSMGKAVDQRTDIWAFGCVLFEMLTGKRAFAGTNPVECLSHILEREPDWSALPETASPALKRVLYRCLEKEPRRRLRSAGDIALALEDLELEAPAVPAAVHHPASPSLKRHVPWLITALAAVVAVIAWLGRWPEPTPDAAVLRFTQASPAPLDISRIGHSGPAVAVSPNGQVLAWVGVVDEGTQIFTRHLDEELPTPVEGTENGRMPFFSPDSQWLGFWADGKLMKVAVRGGTPLPICDLEHPHGAAWGDGVIVLGGAGDGTIWKLDPVNGDLVQLEILGDKSYAAGFPHLLPGDEAILVTTDGEGKVDLIDLESGEVTNLSAEGSNASYLPTGPSSGYLVWTQKDHLVAAPFDLRTRAITGDPQSFVEGVINEALTGSTSHFAISEEGTLAYLPGTITSSLLEPVWVQLDGTELPTLLPSDSSYLSPRVSPDGRKVLLSRQAASRSIWVAEPDRGIIDPVTSDESSQYWGIWTPDGSHVIHNSQDDIGVFNLWQSPVDRRSAATRLKENPGIHLPLDVTRDGNTVVFLSSDGVMGRRFDLSLLDLGSEPEEIPLLASDADELLATLSPDEHWIAYVSDISGTLEIYVQPFPDLGPSIRVTPAGGTEPIWAPDGSRIYYRSLEGRRVFAVDIEPGNPLSIGSAQLLFEGDFPAPIKWGRKWDIHPDGDRFLMLRSEKQHPPDGIRVVVNWDREIESLFSADD